VRASASAASPATACNSISSSLEKARGSDVVPTTSTPITRRSASSGTKAALFVPVAATSCLLTIFDASSNTVYSYALPAKAAEPSKPDSGAAPTVAEIQDFLTKLAEHASVSGANPTDVADQALKNAQDRERIDAPRG